MPHRCTECKKIYVEESPEILRGCECGNRVFQFLKHPNSKLKRLIPNTNTTASPTNGSMQEQITLQVQPQPAQVAVQENTNENPIEENNNQNTLESQTIQDVPTENTPATNEPTIQPKEEVDPAENIKVLEPGAYELNIDRLMTGEPVIVKTENDVYFVSFKVKKGKKRKTNE